MGNLTVYERVELLEFEVKAFRLAIDGLMDRVGELSQPVVIEKIKYRNRAKPLKKKRDGMRPGFDRIKLG